MNFTKYFLASIIWTTITDNSRQPQLVHFMAWLDNGMARNQRSHDLPQTSGCRQPTNCTHAICLWVVLDHRMPMTAKHARDYWCLPVLSWSSS